MDFIQQQIMMGLDQAEQERLQRIQRQWNAYQGDLPKPLRVLPGRPDDNVILELPREIVDIGVAFLFGDELEIAVADEDEDGAKSEWLEDALRHCSPGGAEMLWQRAAINGGATGHVHLKIQPDPESGRLRVLVLDPASVTVTWDQNDVEDIDCYRITWTTLDDAGKPVVRRQRIEEDPGCMSWTIHDEQHVVGGNWQSLAVTPWPYPFAPVVAAQNLPMPNEYYGLSDLEPAVLDTCEAINRVLSHIAKLVRVHGFPKVWTKGVGDVSSVQLGMETILQLPSTTSEIGYLENPGDISASLQLYDRLKRGLFESVRIPEIAMGRLETTANLSGRALRIMYGPLIDKTEAKRRTYGTLIEDLCARLLVVGGQATDVESARVNIHWPELMVSDPLEEAQALAEHQALGVVSKQTIADKLGYDYDTEMERIQQEKDTALDAGLTDVVPPVMPPSAPAPPVTMGGEDAQASES